MSTILHPHILIALNNVAVLSCEDYTLATLWKRAQSFSSHDEGAPFSKLALSKLLVLKDKKAREDYFAQQAAFVMLEGRKDVNAVSYLHFYKYSARVTRIHCSLLGNVP